MLDRLNYFSCVGGCQ